MGFDNVNVNVSGPTQPTSTYKTVVLKGNHSFASQVTESNMKYVIKHDFDLGGESITIPENCVLEFDGGSLNNGILIGNNTRLDGDFNRDCFYGVFYNIDGFPYDYTYKHVIGDPIYVDYIHSAVPNDEVSLNYQSIAVTDDYVFVLCEGTGGKLVIIMYDRETFNVIKIFNTDYSSHANTVCVMEGDLLVGSSNGQTFFYRFNLSSLINAGLNDGECPTPEIVDCSEWSVIGETQSPFAFDYDEENKELAIQFIKQGMDIYNPVNNKVFIFDEHYNYKRSTSNYISGAFEKYKTSIGRQSLVYKNGMCVIYAWITGNSSYRRPIVMYIDTVNDELIGLYSLPTKYTASEPEGSFRVGDDVWSIIVSNGAAICKYSSRQPVLIRTQNNDDGNFIGNSAKLIHIYVDNTYNGIIEDGSQNYPFKSLRKALSVITTDSNTLTFHLKETNNFYIGNFDLEGKSVQITSYGGVAKLILSGKFRNCNVDFYNISLYCDSNYHARYESTPWYYMLVCYGCTVNTWNVHVYGEGGGNTKPGLYRGMFSIFRFSDVTVHNIRLLVFSADNYKGLNQVYLGKITVDDNVPDADNSFILVRDTGNGSTLHAISGFLDSTLNFSGNRLAYGATFESPIVLTNRTDVYSLIMFAARCNIYRDLTLCFYVIFNPNGDVRTTYASLPENMKSAVQTILGKTSEQLSGTVVLYRIGVYSFNNAEHNLCDELGNPILSCTNVSDNDISLESTLNNLCTNPTNGTRIYARGITYEFDGSKWFRTTDNEWHGKNICILGDSLTELGYYTAEVERYLGCTVYNRGWHGATIVPSSGFDSGERLFYRFDLPESNEVATQDGSDNYYGLPSSDIIDMFIVFAGTNDWAHGDDEERLISLGSISDAMSDQVNCSFYAALKQICYRAKIKYPNVPLVLCTLLPSYAYTNTNSAEYTVDSGMVPTLVERPFADGTVAKAQINNAIREVARIFGAYVIDLDKMLGFPDFSKNMADLYYNGGDMTHPSNNFGAKILGRFIAKQIKDNVININN